MVRNTESRVINDVYIAANKETFRYAVCVESAHMFQVVDRVSVSNCQKNYLLIATGTGVRIDSRY